MHFNRLVVHMWLIVVDSFGEEVMSHWQPWRKSLNLPCQSLLSVVCGTLNLYHRWILIPGSFSTVAYSIWFTFNSIWFIRRSLFNSWHTGVSIQLEYRRNVTSALFNSWKVTRKDIEKKHTGVSIQLGYRCNVTPGQFSTVENWQLNSWKVTRKDIEKQYAGVSIQLGYRCNVTPTRFNWYISTLTH